MKTISTAGLAAINAHMGGEPVRYIEIYWADGTLSRHADKDIPGFARGDILSLSQVTQSLNYQGNISNLQFSVTLNDTTGELKHRLDTFNIHKRPCALFQWFTGIPLADAFLLFNGQVFSPMTWNEGDRTLSFDVVTPVYGREVGFSIEEGQFNSIPERLTGQAWPLCFGSVLNVPTTLASDIPTGQVGSVFGVPDATLPYKRTYLENQLALIGQSYGTYRMLEERCHMATLDYDIRTQVIRVNGSPNSLTFVLASSGVISDSIAIQTQSPEATANAIRRFLDEAIDYELVTVGEGKPGAEANFDASQVSLEFDNGDNGSGKTIMRSCTITNWPYPVVVQSYLANSGSVTCDITAVQLEGGQILNQDQLSTAILQRPSNLRIAYIDAIKTEDQLKQELEDLQVELDKNFSQYQALLDLYNADRANFDIKNRLIAVSALRDGKFNLVKEKHAELYRASYDKKKCEIDISNLTLVFDTIGKVRAKQKEIIEEYTTLNKSYLKLVEIIAEQEDKLGSKTLVSGYQYFPQGSQNVAVGRAKFSGNLDGRSLTTTAVRNDHVNVRIDARETPGLDTFWVVDDTLDLKGKYCRIQNGRIIKVVDQVGRQCRFSPVRNGESTRNRNKEFPLSGGNVDALRKGLGDLLTGRETNAELLYILNSLPSDLSPATKQRLIGASIQTTLTLSCPIAILTPDDSNFGAPTVGRSTSIDLTWQTFNASFFKLAYQGSVTDEIPISAENEEIKEALYAKTKLKTGDITVTGGPLVGQSGTTIGNVVITIVSDIAGQGSITVAESHVTYTPEDATDLTKDPGITIVASFDSDGAQEYTKKTRTNKIDNAIDSSKYGKDLNKLQSRIKQLVKDIEAAATNKRNTDVMNQGLKNAQATYQKLLSLVQIPKSVTEEANRVVSQEEYKNLFQLELLQSLYVKRYIDNTGHNLPDPADQYYFTGRDITYISEVSEILPGGWLLFLNNLGFDDFMDEVRMLPDSEAFVANVGDVITNDADFQEVYVANILPSTVRAVYAYRNVDGYRQFTPLPTSYYIKSESDTGYAPLTLTTIALRRPLREYKDENWEDGVYVSLTSSVGPNAVDVIQFIVSNYTTLVTDATSFNYVRNKVANYPTNFAILDKQDSLRLIENIAYQSRCAVWTVNGVLKITYLPELTSSVMTITDTEDIEVGTFQLGFTDTENLVTKSINTYRVAYNQEKDYSLILRANLNRYGEQLDNYNYTCLTDRRLVEKSATYWMIQKANTWKLVTFKGMLNLLILEPFDIVTLSLTYPHIASTGSCYARVMSVGYDSDTETVDISLWIPIRCGEMTQYMFAWPSANLTTDIFPTVDDALSGNAGNPFSSDVPLGVEYDPYDNSLLAFRPDDYGSIHPTDLVDSLPNDPTQGLEENGAKGVGVQNFQLPAPVAPAAPVAAEVEMKGAADNKPNVEDARPRDVERIDADDVNSGNYTGTLAGEVIMVHEPIESTDDQGDLAWIPSVEIMVPGCHDTFTAWDVRHLDPSDLKAMNRLQVGDKVEFRYQPANDHLVITRQRRGHAK